MPCSLCSLSLYEATLVFGEARNILSSWRLIESDILPDGDDVSHCGFPYMCEVMSLLFEIVAGIMMVGYQWRNIQNLKNK